MLFTAIFFSIIMIFLVISLTIRSTYSTADGDDSNTYASRDMVIVSYSNKFCDALSIKGSSTTDLVTSTLYLLNRTPLTTRKELISFTREPTLYNSYQYWMFHLLPSSAIQLTACISNTGAGPTTFYLVKGASNFAKRKFKYPLINKQVNEMCPGGSNSHVFLNYATNAEDQYYLIFESKYYTTSLKLTFNITQVLYNITEDMMVANCSVVLSSDSCRLPVPLTSSTTALLALQPQQGSAVDWEANNSVHVHCSARVWFYVVVCLLGALGIILVILTVASILYIYRRKHTTNTTAANTRGNRSTFNNQVSPAIPSAPAPPENTPLLSGPPLVENPQELASYMYKFEPPPKYKP